MTFTFKLSRRLAIAYCGSMLLAALALIVGCSSSDLTTASDAESSVIRPNYSTAEGDTSKSRGKGRGRGRRESTASLVKVVVTPDPASVAIGASTRFAAVGVLSDGSKIQPKVTWSASGGTIDSTGLYTAGRAGGSYRVTAQSDSVELADTASVAVGEQQSSVTAITLSPESVTLATGGTQRMTATARFSDGSTGSANVTYSATGGGITEEGVYTAGQMAGTFRVIAMWSGTLADTAQVTVTNEITDCAAPCVSAGPDVTGSVGQAITLRGQAPNGWKVLWTVVSGPARGKFAHESFVADFEEGTIGEWTGTPIQDQCGQRLGPDGAQGGLGSAVTTVRPHTGRYGWEAYNNPNDCDPIGKYSSKLLRWRYPWAQWYGEGWFWWPADYSMAATSGGGYLNLMQWKEGVAPYDPTYIVAVTGRYTGTDEFVIHDYKGQRLIRTGATVPKGRWVHLAAWMKASELWVWVDGKLITRQTGINMRGLTGAGQNLMWGVGNYSEYGVGDRLWWDDVSATADAGQVLAPTFTAPAAGTYTVRIVASDGVQSQAEETVVTVR